MAAGLEWFRLVLRFFVMPIGVSFKIIKESKENKSRILHTITRTDSRGTDYSYRNQTNKGNSQPLQVGKCICICE